MIQEDKELLLKDICSRLEIENAEAYDEALERAKKFYGKEIAEEIFPELKESEDEKIKKAIIEFFESEDDNTTYSLVRKKDIIDWLKRQGEQYPSQTNERAWLYLVSDVLTWKDGIGQYLDDPRVQELAKKLCKEYAQKLYNPSVLSNSSDTGKNEQNYTDKIEPIFKVGDWVVNKFGDSWHIVNLDKKNYQVSDGKGNYNYFPISKQDEMHLWTMQDAKDGDVICYKDEISLYKNEIENCNKEETTFGGFVYYCCYDGKRFITNSFYILTEQDEIDIYPATKEQRDILFQKIKEAGYKWNIKTKTLDKLVKPKFDPKTLKPYDKVLVRDDDPRDCWRCAFYSHTRGQEQSTLYRYATTDNSYTFCIPYNDDTKHLVGTMEEAPEYYRYWED